MRNKILFVILFGIISLSLFSNESKFDFNKNDITFSSPAKMFDVSNVITLIHETAMTTSNDTAESSWVDVEGYDQLSLWLWVDDSARVDYYIDYKVSSFTEITLAVDSIKTNATALTGKSKSIILRGYGASGIVNLIPGATKLRYRAYWNVRSETSIAHDAVLIKN